MKSRYFSLILITGLMLKVFCLADSEQCSYAGRNSKKSSQISFRDEANSDAGLSECGNESHYEPTDVEAHTAEDPNSCTENETVMCDPSSPYRTINGSCNNLNHPNWGVSTECYLRFQPAYYKDFGSIRRSTKGGSLPEPRVLTLNIFKNMHRPTRNVSFMFTIFGRTVAHDLSLALQEDPPGPCCAPENKGAPECIPITVPPYDPFYSKFNVTCLEMNRTLACTSCDNANRQQSNGATAALDASIVYGTDDEKSNQVRANDGTGKLKSNNTENGELLPTGKDPFDIFCYRKIESKCFFAGDVRVNQHTTLSSLQTLYMREHNRIATEMKSLNPHWDEERLFHEARPPDVPYGNDLSSTDMQRGRDHGLAPYVHLVRFCFGSNANISSFEDLAPGLMSRKNANLLKKNYKSVDDVDLWAGAQMEHHLPGSEVGPTAACIIAKQLYATKFGDRFYFEHEGEVPSFTPDQRASLKQCSLSRMLCDNTPIKEIQKNVMLLQSTKNPKVSCNDIPKIDLTLWKENSSK
ncbi:unnamed protein product [Larinioides sclopetarius]|uniref:Peroxidase n=1 Tax=Larinioides sclopetarius TaxID=280406 RepID=A0AAV2BIC9_9ARAC